MVLFNQGSQSGLISKQIALSRENLKWSAVGMDSLIDKTLSKKSKCPCGTGKKYYKCCRRKQLSEKDIEVVRKKFTKKFRERDDFIESYGHTRPPQGIEADGKTMFSIGGYVYLSTRDGPYSFMEMLHEHAFNFFGEDFINVEVKKPVEEMHTAALWFKTMMDYVAEIRRLETPKDEVESIGALPSWTRLAFDLYTIRDQSELQKEVRKRLMSHLDFQSARHELWVAALFVAAGFSIDYEDESDNSKKHPEFIATHKESKIRVAVEAKSRRRKGVKGFSSGKDSEIGREVGIRSLILDSFKKETSYPLYVFVDANLPFGDKEARDRWLTEINQTFSDIHQEGYLDSCVANMVIVHNDPAHFSLEQELGKEGDSVWFYPVQIGDPKIQEPLISMRDILTKANRQRLTPPMSFTEFN